MRIGTWNLAGRWSPPHLELLTREKCDVWLLAEVHPETAIPGMQMHRTTAPMGERKTWAAICSNADLSPAKSEPHWATVAADIGGLTVISSVLPWRSRGPEWGGSTLAEDLRRTLDAIRARVNETTIWGGDWNQALEGGEHAGSLDGRSQILELLNAARLSVPTRSLGSAAPGHRSIDHIAVPMGWDVDDAYRVTAEAEGQRLSDHDLYVISVTPDRPSR
ncbi:hypothetical protein [Terrabacter sp. BE26]|uniref:hypothetical protein n=1 Tax=Terrabacter sp. BE26 TaxID=2898152 RepID=UPI0035BE8583